MRYRAAWSSARQTYHRWVRALFSAPSAARPAGSPTRTWAVETREPLRTIENHVHADLVDSVRERDECRGAVAPPGRPLRRGGPRLHRRGLLERLRCGNDHADRVGEHGTRARPVHDGVAWRERRAIRCRVGVERSGPREATGHRP